VRIRIGHLSTFYHTAMILMAGETIEKKLSANIEWKLFGTGPAIVNAFERGDLEMAYIGLPPAIIGISRGVDIVCVAGGHIEGTVIAGKKDFVGFPEAEDLPVILDQFRERKVGVPGKGSIHEVIMTEILERFNLKREVEVIHYPWSDQIVEAMVRGEVSVAVGTPALAVAVERYACGKILYPPARLWPYNPSYGILVDKQFLKSECELVERFLILHEEATSLIRKKPWDVAKMISDYIGFIDAAFVFDTLKVSPKYCAQLTDEYIFTTMEFVKVMKKLEYIAEEISPDDIFDTSIIRKIHFEKDHYSDGIADKLL
jgi:NitT/TauT family transport system substrate-binding protein